MRKQSQFLKKYWTLSALMIVATTSGNVIAEDKISNQKPWELTLGAGVISAPEYPGSDNMDTRGLPIINARYKRAFIGGAAGAAIPGGIGIYLYEDEAWTLAAVASLGVIDPRDESDDERLRGLGDVEGTTRAGILGSYRSGWLSLSGSVLTDVEGNDQGTVVNLDARGIRKVSDRLILSAGPGISWGDKDYMQTLFGVNSEQAINSDFSPYQAEGGVSLLRFSISAQYQLTGHWGIGANITAARLQGDAADSPITESKNQNMYGLFTTYRF